MKNILIILLLPQLVFSQIGNLDVFENLMNKEWKAEGQWGDGSVFKQHINFEYSLDGNLVIANTKGFTDKERKSFGDRNHGIRKFNKEKNQIEFWEFDIFGGLTQGTVTPIDKNILYQYKYGESYVSEMWEYVNDSTYNFKIGDYKDGKWGQIYLSTQFIATLTPNIHEIFASLKHSLNGNWSSEAWDGQLNESWHIDKNGHLTQSAQYIEEGKVLYEASNKMEVVNNELILFTVIKDNNPKIFKATFYSEDRIVFENSDYKNPNKVIYNFGSKDEFQRTISGIENNEPSDYTFNFKRIK